MIGELGLVLVALLLVLLNGFLVLAEFAIVKVRATRLDELAEKGVRNAKAAREVVARLETYLTTTQLGITLASLALGWIGEPAFEGLYRRVVDAPGWLPAAAAHATSAALAFTTIAFLHILIGELAPRFIAIQHAEASALFVAQPVRVVHRLLAVPMSVIHGAARAVLRLFRIRSASESEVTYSEEELRSILGASQERGGFSFHHLLLLENAFDFGTMKLEDIVIPLDRVTFLDASAPWPENAAVIAEKRLSRYPLRDGPKGKILGFIHVKTVLVDLLAGRTPDLSREIYRLPRAPGDLMLEVALRRLQKSGAHMGLVTDAKGQDVGMFTLEDIVEELIGDIRDEFEPSPEVSLYDLLTANRIALDPEATTKDELIAVLAELASDGSHGADERAAVDAVLRREKAVPASIGGGIAVPHARVPALTESRAALVRLKDPVDYQAPDGRPVRLAILLLTPEAAAPGTQARFLQRTAGLLQSDYIRDRLLGAESPEEVREVIRIGETSAAV